MELALAIIGLLTAFYSGAVTEVETNGQITSSINYTVDTNKTTICKEYYPKIIITDI